MTQSPQLDRNDQLQNLLEFWQQKLETSQENSDRQGEAIALGNLGLVYLELEEYALAIEKLDQCRVIARGLPDRQIEQQAILALANSYYYQGRQQYFQQIPQVLAALQSWKRSLTLYREINYRQGEMQVLQALGIAHDGFYDRHKAIEYFQKSLAIAEELGDHLMQGRLLGDLSVPYLALENYNKAIEYADRSLAVARKLKTNNNQLPATALIEVARTEWLALSNLGHAYFLQKNYERAVEYYEQMLVIALESQDPFGEMQALHNLGAVYLDQEEYDKSADKFQQALALANELNDPQQQAIGLVALGRVAKQRGNISEAIKYYEDSIKITESIRGILKVSENAASFANLWISDYEELINLLVSENYFQEAFNYVERARSRSFLDQLANARIDFRAGADADLIKRGEALEREIIRLRREDPFNEQLQALEQEYQDWLTELKTHSPETAALKSVDVASIAEIQERLDTDTTLAEYFVTDERTLAFLLTKDSFKTVALDVRREKLTKEIHLFQDHSEGDNLYPDTLQNLYDWLIAPLKSDFKTPKLSIVPHSILHYLPFAALTDGERYLVEDYTLLNLPSASTLRFLPDKISSGTETILILGDPSVENQPSLPFSRESANEIADLFNTKALVGKEATESAVWSKATNAKILHIAAHGKFYSNNPLFSTIHLAPDEQAENFQKDGQLEVHEVYNLKLIATNLVVLSACETTLGKLSQGDEVVGLNRAFIYAGTPTLIASLWQVDERATALLMRQFYTHLKAGIGKAEALRQAQMEMRTDYPHPDFWAAFVLTGDGGESSQQESG